MCLTWSQMTLQVCLMVPWGLQLLFYSFLYRAFPRDRDRSTELDREGRLRHSNSETGILAAGGQKTIAPQIVLWNTGLADVLLDHCRKVNFIHAQ